MGPENIFEEGHKIGCKCELLRPSGRDDKKKRGYYAKNLDLGSE